MNATALKKSLLSILVLITLLFTAAPSAFATETAVDVTVEDIDQTEQVQDVEVTAGEASLNAHTPTETNDEWKAFRADGIILV